MGSNPMWLVPCKKRRFGHRHTQRDNHVKTGGRTAISQPRTEASEGTDPADTGSWSSSLKDREKVDVRHASYCVWYVVMAAVAPSATCTAQESHQKQSSNTDVLLPRGPQPPRSQYIPLSIGMGTPVWGLGLHAAVSSLHCPSSWNRFSELCFPCLSQPGTSQAS